MGPEFKFVLGVLATYRLSLLVAKESGPARIFRKLRNIPPPKSATKEGLSCQLCLSMHFAIPVTGFLMWDGTIENWGWAVIWWLALSAASIVIHMHTTKNL